MPFQYVQTEKAPAAIGPYSQAVQAGPWLFVSGQIPLVPETGHMVGEDFEAQARQVLQNIQAVLSAAGYGLGDVVSVDVFLTDLGMFQTFNALYEKAFGAHKPARAVVQVSALPRGAQIEIKCIAVKA
ncbi:MAG: RidA family protein [Desulfosoma sp.]